MASLAAAPDEVPGADRAGRLAGLGLGSGVETAGIEIDHAGAPGTLIASLVSLDQSRNHALETPLKDPQEGMYRSSGSHPWRIDGPYRSVLYLKNVTPREVFGFAVVRYAGGQYATPRMKFAPHQTLAVDFAKLRDAQEPDLDGNILPAAIAQGKVVWYLEEADSLIGRVETVSATEGLSSSFSCFYPCTCNPNYFSPNDSDSWMLPASLLIPVGGSELLSTRQKRYDCNYYNLGTFDITSSSTFWSENTAILGISGTFANGLAAGTTFADTQMPRRTVTPPLCPASSSDTDNNNTKVFSVDITSANIKQDSIGVTLAPAGLSGTLNLELIGSPNFTIRTVERSAGTYTENFNISSMPKRDYTQVKATWTVSGKVATDTFAYHFKHLGTNLHTQYNTPNESACALGSMDVYIITNLSQCFNSYISDTLKPTFASQVALNGTGRSENHGILKALAASSCKDATQNRPADATNSNTFVKVSSVTGSCNTSLSSTTVASCRSSANGRATYACSDKFYLKNYPSGSGTDKTDRDPCPECCQYTDRNASYDNQFDNYNPTNTECSGHAVGDLVPQPTATFQVY